MKPSSNSILRHIVLFKFLGTSPEKDISAIHQAFLALSKAIPVVRDFEWGLNDSPENHHQGFTHCYMVTFDSEKDRDEGYTPHPRHLAFVELLQPHLEKVFVVDYWARNQIL